MVLKCCTQYVSKFGNPNSQWSQDWKRSTLIQIPKKGSTKECSNHWTIVIISHGREVMLKILQARLPGYVSQELPDVQAGFRKGRWTRDLIANIRWIVEEAREFQKICTFASLTMLRPLTVWVKTNCGKFLKRDGNLTCLLRNLYVDQEAAARTHMEQLTDSGWRRSTTRLFIVTLFI